MHVHTLLSLLVVCVLFVDTHAQSSSSRTSSSSPSSEYTLSLVHLNDFHARFEETSVYSGRCSAGDAATNRCYGGFGRIKTKVQELKRTEPNVLFMAAGDYFQGTVWYTIHKWKAIAHFLNLMDQDVMSLGNHEFDDGIPGLVPFLDHVNFPVLAANIDDSNEPSIRGKILPSIVFTKGGRRIGVVGYVTTETVMIAQPGRVRILDEVEAVRAECQRLKRDGVDIIVALGHAGFRKDLDVAMSVQDVDIVVGGHTNTFLYTGSDPSTEPSVGEYPTIVKQNSGRTVLVVQAYAFGKYLGFLQATFDAKGEIVRWKGNPIVLDNTVAQDPMILRELIPWRQQVGTVIEDTIGRTFVFLDGNRLSCRMRECNMGNLQTDAIIHMNAKYPDDLEWGRTALAVINGGGIRSSIDERAANGSISMEDILTVAPFQNTIDIVVLKGRYIKEMFEHSVKSYDSAGLDPAGTFLQVSGFSITYDISRPPGRRVVSLKARCIACRIPTMESVEDKKVYKIAMPSFIANGGDGYDVIKNQKISHHLTGLLDTDIMSQYIRLYSPIYQGLENRILFQQPEPTTDLCSALPAPPLPSNFTTSTTLLPSSPSTTTRAIVSSSTSTPSSAPNLPPSRVPSTLTTGLPLLPNLPTTSNHPIYIPVDDIPSLINEISHVVESILIRDTKISTRIPSSKGTIPTVIKHSHVRGSKIPTGFKEAPSRDTKIHPKPKPVPTRGTIISTIIEEDLTTSRISTKVKHTPAKDTTIRTRIPSADVKIPTQTRHRFASGIGAPIPTRVQQLPSRIRIPSRIDHIVSSSISKDSSTIASNSRIPLHSQDLDDIYDDIYDLLFEDVNGSIDAFERDDFYDGPDDVNISKDLVDYDDVDDRDDDDRDEDNYDDFLKFRGPLHNPSRTTPHAMVKETMDRHDQLFFNHTSQTRRTPVHTGHLVNNNTPKITRQIATSTSSIQTEKIFQLAKPSFRIKKVLKNVRPLLRESSEDNDNNDGSSVINTFFNFGEQSDELDSSHFKLGQSVV